MSHKIRSYIVSFRKVAEVTELVEATSAQDAIRKVKQGLGERMDFNVDETRAPTNYKATRDDGETS